MAGAGRVVPWLHWNEWSGVRAALLSDSPSEQRAGLQRVDVWRHRGKIPVAVASTANLVEIKQLDDEGRVSVQSLRLQYSMAIVRFVSGVSDLAQNKFYADSVANVAEGLGLPRFLVDLRHEAVHAQLPSLEILRDAYQQAMTWLRCNYWEPQDVRHQHTIRRIKKHLQTYRAEYGQSGAEVKLAKQTAFTIRQLLGDVKGGNFDDIISPLLDNGFMAPMVSQRERIKKKGRKATITVWMGLIHHLDTLFPNDFITALIYALAERWCVEGQGMSFESILGEGSRLVFLFEWLVHFFTEYTGAGEEKPWTVHQMNWSAIVDLCLDIPSPAAVALTGLMLQVYRRKSPAAKYLKERSIVLEEVRDLLQLHPGVTELADAAPASKRARTTKGKKTEGTVGTDDVIMQMEAWLQSQEGDDDNDDTDNGTAGNGQGGEDSEMVDADLATGLFTPCVNWSPVQVGLVAGQDAKTLSFDIDDAQKLDVMYPVTHARRDSGGDDGPSLAAKKRPSSRLHLPISLTSDPQWRPFVIGSDSGPDVAHHTNTGTTRGDEAGKKPYVVTGEIRLLT